MGKLSLQLSEARLATVGDLHALIAKDGKSISYGEREASLDNFAHLWMLSRDWKPGAKVLDVGCGYSSLPAELREKNKVEAWGADDFGRSVGDQSLLRGQRPEDLPKK